MSDRPVINFGAGPSKLPTEVLIDVQNTLLNYDNSGMSVMELSHRSKDYDKINDNGQKCIRELLNIPNDYAVLFMQGGGTGIFAAVALNLMTKSGTADYFITGIWSAKAAKEAEKYGKVNSVLPKMEKYDEIPDKSTWKLDPNASYVYYCDNETVNGIEFPFIPDTKGVPLVADMSSNILTRKFDITKFAIIFAGAQKNIGPPGVVLVIVKRDLLGKAMPICPTVLDFNIMARDNSLHNTPPTFSIFVMWRVFEWIKERGGIKGMEDRAKQKSSLIYDTIDQSEGFYSCTVKKPYRSRMNVPFIIPGHPELEVQFLNEAEQLKMVQLKGHRMVGGIRASLYNAITVDEAKVLADFMKSFRNKNIK
ncbi:phosphoserine aminotransferase [Lycorma delicatula]|uniref:phosphoserine aminotransferase n=1 Tax=Lycorma delicatula TaxID=130591 RepID=UPI003F513F4A